MPIGSPQWMYTSGAEDQTITKSLRFNDDDTAYLSWTPTSAGNRKTWTWSAWVKQGHSGQQAMFGAAVAGNAIYFESDGQLTFEYYNGSGGTNFYKQTSARLRDPSAWYHIVAVWNTTSGTAADRMKLYVNGTRLTAFDTDNQPPLNQDSHINNAIAHNVGNRGFNPLESTNWDGYLAEVHFIDGQALGPEKFGRTGDYGEWLALEYNGEYGTNGFYLSFTGGGIMAATGGTITTDGDYKVHSFTADGTFTPTSVPDAGGYVEYLVIAGGGSGGNGYRDPHYRSGGGGGAGGYRTGYLAVTAQAYSITVGDGGAARPDITSSPWANPGLQGENSVFSTITSIGGGGGGSGQGGAVTSGGSGGGGSHGGTSSNYGAGTAGQGNDGGYGTGEAPYSAGGGGGAGSAGTYGSNSSGSGAGGSGKASSITGSSVTRAGGGGGGGTGSDGAAGSGGGTAGDSNAAATANTGSGSGGSANSSGGVGAGGSGIVIIRYKFQ